MREKSRCASCSQCGGGGANAKTLRPCHRHIHLSSSGLVDDLTPHPSLRIKGTFSETTFGQLRGGPSCLRSQPCSEGENLVPSFAIQTDRVHSFPLLIPKFNDEISPSKSRHSNSRRSSEYDACSLVACGSSLAGSLSVAWPGLAHSTSAA